jgi:hypothetical protein
MLSRRGSGCPITIVRTALSALTGRYAGERRMGRIAPQPTLTLAGTNRRCWVMGWTPPGASTSLFAITDGLGPCITVPHLSQPSFRGTL